MKEKCLQYFIIAAIVLCGILGGLLYHQEVNLKQLQNNALVELAANSDGYDGQSIVLQGTTRAKAERLAKRFGAKLRITEDGSFATLTLPEGTTIQDVYADDNNLWYLSQLSTDYRVRISELEEEETPAEHLPVRPQYNVTDDGYARQGYLDYMNMGSVWGSYTGNGVTVAVIDTGIDTDHPEFSGRISKYSYNATEDKIVKDYSSNGGYDWSLIEDEQGHGTAVAGVLAAAMDGSGTVGVAPKVNILVIKAECVESGEFARYSDLVFGLYYAIERDVQVVNMSFGTSINIFAEAAQLAYDSDIICVASAGNENTAMLHYPAADKNVIGVGALADNSWERADYSNYGENVDIMAPGSTYTACMGGGYEMTQGTSLAAPAAAGAIALLMQNSTYTTFDKVTEILYASCYDLGDLGRDWYYGFGALDVDTLLNGERGTVTFDMLTDELENEEALFIRGRALQEMPEPERQYAVFDGWYYDDTFTQECTYYTDAFTGDVTLYAKWVNEDDGIPFTYVILDDNTVEIRSYTGHRRFITVPHMIEGRIVSSIGDFAFSGENRLREVTLPGGLTNIGYGAFNGCANLVSIQIPEGVVSIGGKAFQDNVRLSSVAFQGSSKLKTIGDFAFSGCGKLEKLELPATVQTVNGSAFYVTTSLQSITVQPGNSTYKSLDGVLFNISGTEVVAYPAARGDSYALPEGCITIGQYAFACAELSTLDLAGVQAIGTSAFTSSSLKSVVIPDSVTDMQSKAFMGCENLTQVTIGNGLASISGKAFRVCSSLRSVTIPAGIESIGESAFEESGLREVDFAGNSQLSDIGGYAFFACSIDQIKIPASVKNIGEVAFACNPLTAVEFADGSVLNTIGDSAFSECRLLTSIHLPDKLASIGEMAFASTGLQAVTIPASVTTLGVGAFGYCDDLTAITVEAGNTVYHDNSGVVYTLDDTVIHTFPAGMEASEYSILEATTRVGSYAFAGTKKLTTVHLPEGMQEIGEYGFHASGIQRMQIPDNVIQISRYSFAECWDLASVTFNETSKLPRISFGAFAYCGITSFRVPASVSTMAQYAFEGCPKLTAMTFAENSKLESISAYMFDGCENLQSITFENGSALTSIQAHGLEGMDKLTSINFGDAAVTNVDNFAFRFCASLSELDLPDSVTNVGQYAFYGCGSLSELTLPADMEHIGSYAFLGTKDMNLYLSGDSVPAYLDENWDHGIQGYYVGVTGVATSGDYKYGTLTSGNVAIIEYLGTSASVDLTSVDLGAPITAIGGSAFQDSSVTSIVLPDTLTEIQAEAFAYTALESVTIPANVTFIGREAFAHTDIRELTFSGQPKLRVIEQYAFTGTEKLTSVTLPASLTTMGTGVFQESGLTGVIFADGIALTEIPQRAFAETKLTSVALPDSVTLVNHNAFNNVQTLKSVSFGSGEGIRLMSNAFYHTGLTELHIPANVTYIGEYCFVALPNLTSFSVDSANPNYKAEDGLLLTKSGRKLIAVPAGRTGSLTVPVSVEEIGFGAFEESKLSQVNFNANANILSFGYRAFFKANNLTSITVPASVVSVDYYAFAYCENLETVTFAQGNLLKGIYEGAFCGDTKLKNITIPDAIVEISDFAFYGCSALDKIPVTQTTGVKGIYDYAFAYTGLSGDLTTPESLIDIGSYAFLGTKVEKVTVPDTNKKDLIIGIGAFEDCNSLTEITLPFIGASFENMEISWFGYIFGAGAPKANASYVPESLKVVTITDGITVVGISGFEGCSHLTQIHVPSSVKKLFYGAFKDTNAVYELSSSVQLEITSILTEPENKNTSSFFGSGISGKLAFSYTGNSSWSVYFKGCSNLESVVIPAGVTDIGKRAFSGCVNLCSVELPGGINTIEESAFAACSALTSIHIPNSVTSIGKNAFNGCTLLNDLYLPDSLATLGENAFIKCENLINIHVSDSHPAYCIKDGILYDKPITKIVYVPYKLSGDVTIAEGVVAVDGFSGNQEIVRITLPNSATSIEKGAFENCEKLSHVTISPNVTTIGAAAFSCCQMLTTITIPDSVTVIGSGAFHYCINLRKITIPKNVETIAENAFWDCYGLDIVINNSSLPISLGSKAHGMVANYAAILVDKDGNRTSCEGYEDFDFVDTADGFRFSYVNNAYTLIAYLGHEDTVTLPDAINGSNYTISQLSGVENVIIPEGVTSIGDGAFKYNTRLRSVHIPDSVTDIGEWAFYQCTSLETVSLGSVSAIKPKTFEGCSSLEAVSIPDTVTCIGDSAFRECKSLTSIEIPQAVTAIEGGAFFSCYKLKHISLQEGITSIGNGAFRACKSLESIKIPSSVTYIGDDAFAFCSNLISVEIPDGITHIGQNAFPSNLGIHFSENGGTYCAQAGIVYSADMKEIIRIEEETMPRNVVLPHGVESLNGAFKNCSTLESISIPGSVKSIEGQFSGCDALKHITLQNGVTTIGEQAFWNLPIASISIPETVTYVADNAFEWCSSLEKIILSEKNEHYCLIDGVLYDKEITRIVAIPPRISGHVTIPPGITELPGSMGESFVGRTFAHCGRLTGITLPNTITTIPNGSFMECRNLTELTIPESVTFIGERAFEYCIRLYKVENRSDITLTIGSKDNGFVACYARALIDKNGNVTCAQKENAAYFVIDDFLFVRQNDAYSLCAYLGEQETVTLPDNCNGSAYTISGFSGAREVIIPNSITTIGDSAFTDNISLTSVSIPNSVTEIKDGAFRGCEGLYNNPKYTINGALIIDGWLIDVEDTTKYLSGIRHIDNVAYGAYKNCSHLKSAVWGRPRTWSLTNLETTYLTHIDETTPVLMGSVTQKNIVIMDSVRTENLRSNPNILGSISGVTIWVEETEASLRWDDNFPNWNNGNLVSYGDNWHWTNFYDQDGTLVFSEPQWNSQVIRRPVMEDYEDEGYAYRFLGWDLDGDGTVDDIPATSVTDIEAVAVYGCTVKTYTVEFSDLSSGEVYSEQTLAYGSVITAPADPTKDGTFFEGWRGYTEGMTVTGDIVITPIWHSHRYEETVTEPTCSTLGYTTYSCTCGDTYTDNEVETTEHTWDEGTVTKEPTESAEGEKTFTCTVCSATKTESVPKLSHTHKHEIAVTAPTCTVAGYTTYTCTCGDSYTGDMVAAKGHRWDEGKVTKEPTETAEGEKTFTCAHCGETRAETIAKLPVSVCEHQATGMRDDKKATCTAAGYTGDKFCLICGETLEKGTQIPVTEHSWKDGECSVCGAEDPNWTEPSEPTGPETVRIYGDNRFATAFAVADQMKVNLGIQKFEAVIVASGTNFADALSGSYLAAVKNAPILLSFNDKYNELAKDYIWDNLTPGGTVYILGGTAAVPASMEEGLDNFNIVRLAGKDRFGTNLAILEEAGVGDKPVLVCTGLSFADSLSASATKLPILLVWKNLTKEQKAFLDDHDGNIRYVIGGESAVSADMFRQVIKGSFAMRIGGSNRFETSVNIAKQFFGSPDSAVLAYAWNYPDGLCGGALAATMDAPLILTMTKYEAKAAEYIQGQKIQSGAVLGGVGLISVESVDMIFCTTAK